MYPAYIVHTESVGAEFGPFEGRVWLNTAHQGPLPTSAVAALMSAAADKVAPGRMADRSFLELPQRLRMALAAIVGGRPVEIVLGNSASWGLQVIANGFPWQRGDEVAVIATDYPATIHPWLVTERRGVRVRRLTPEHPFPDPEELVAGLGPRTRLLCVTWVDSYSGYRLDVAALATLCRARGVRLVVNATQAVGAVPVDVGVLGIDALSASGFKWLCGPYGTGFAWLSHDLLEMLEPTQSYWLARAEDAPIDLGARHEPRLLDGLGARGFDVFGTANFFNFAPWLASLELLLRLGSARVADHDADLVGELVERLRGPVFRLLTPVSAAAHAAIVSFDLPDEPAERTVTRLAEAGIDVASRDGHVRVSPHLHNTSADIERLFESIGQPRS